MTTKEMARNCFPPYDTDKGSNQKGETKASGFTINPYKTELKKKKSLIHSSFTSVNFDS